MLMYLRSWITNNWVLKLFSLLLAFLLWVTIASDISSDIRRTVDLEFQSTPQGTVITNETHTEVDLFLRGSSSLLNQLAPSDVRAVISLSGQMPGPKTFTLSQANIRAPAGVEILRITPSTVQFNLERVMTRTLPVRANVQGEPAEGYEIVGQIFVSPSTVDVSGPESSIRPLDALTTTAIRIDGARNDVREVAFLGVVDPQVQVRNPARLEVFVRIAEVQVTASYDVSLDPSMAEAGWRVGAESIEVTLRGPRSRIAALNPEGLYFGFDAADMEADTNLVRPRILGLDPSVTAVSTNPETVPVISAPE